MKVLVIGSGAREHAIVCGLLTDPGVTDVVCAPGNAGIALDAPTVVIDANDPAAIAALAASAFDGSPADLVVIGPEVPLVNGAADAVRAAGIACFGPGAEAAQLEGSKAFAKDVMAAAEVPTAMAHVCETLEEVSAALDQFGAPHVVKDDGLAAGKGVVVTNDRAEALAHAEQCLAKSGGRVVIEEYLDGPEVSLFCITDGIDVVPLLPAQDFKRVGDGDLGPNTGGMGAYTPLDWTPHGMVDEVVERVALPVVREMAHRGTPFSGLLYVGLAVTHRGIRVIEFNARFGDPETQAVLALLESGLGALLYASATGHLGQLPPLIWNRGAAVTVVVAAGGYPASPRSGDVITGLEAAGAVEGVRVFHAGTTHAVEEADAIVATGGRVLAITARGASLAEARDRAYDAVKLIELDGSHYRSDIALAAVCGEVTVPG
ncbi:MAG: phosphoribosylamine--glycine ligase [Actinobacteria bacterium]|nr:phosphoribosylamine--glycine ligase [Actinomycetota bacterium]